MLEIGAVLETPSLTITLYSGVGWSPETEKTIVMTSLDCVLEYLLHEGGVAEDSINVS